jgi:hypothetical protein
MFFGVYNTTNDSGSDTCSEKAEKSSHESDIFIFIIVPSKYFGIFE